jgi:lysyl-tRNA synthetase class I
LEKLDNFEKEKIQEVLSNFKRSRRFPKEAFQGFYQTLLGQPFGPKAADLIVSMRKEKVIEKLSI